MTLCGTDEIDIGSQETGNNFTYQWYKNGNLTSFTGHTKNNIHLNPGTYRLRVTKTSTGCTSLSAPFQITCPSGKTDEADDLTFGATQALTLDIHPNPANSRATITYQTSDDGQATLAVFDISGRLVREEVELDSFGSSYELELSDLPNGIYLVQLTSAGNRTTKRLSVVR